MARTLDVYLNNDLAGHLVQENGGQMSFAYAEGRLAKPDATPISRSLPPRTEPFRRNECRGFFAGILPEESNRDIIAHNPGISARNDYAMLERIGGECAGALPTIKTVHPVSEKVAALIHQRAEKVRNRTSEETSVRRRPRKRQLDS